MFESIYFASMKSIRLNLMLCLLTGLSPVNISGIQRAQDQDGSDHSVKIGLLIPDNNTKGARQGAELAIKKANEKGGLNGKPFTLVTLSMEGPWGTGSKEAVDLIFKENVCAIMGSSNGRNGHLIEQVTTKARIVYLSSLTSDPTLSQAFVPWFFTCVPNDLQQAGAFIDEIYNKRKFTKIALLYDNDYDSKMASESFVKETKSAGKPAPIEFSYDNSALDYSSLADQVIKAEVSAVILFGKPAASLRIMKLFRQRNLNQIVFGSLSTLDENAISAQDLKFYENVIFISSESRVSPKELSFRKEFQLSYGNLPGPAALYSFDGMCLLIEAIKTAGTDREGIRKCLANLHLEGVTGLIRFDEKGKRVGIPGLIEIKNGIPVTLER
jgi:branched-chain amino acid transport system substrate-binding protein